MPALQILLAAKVGFLLAFFIVAVALGPFPDGDSRAALLTAFAGVAGMAVQNAVQRLHLATLMSGNTTQAAVDAVDLIRGVEGDNRQVVCARFVRTLLGIIWFAAGCAVAAVLYYWAGFWCLVVPVVVGAATAIRRAES